MPGQEVGGFRSKKGLRVQLRDRVLVYPVHSPRRSRNGSQGLGGTWASREVHSRFQPVRGGWKGEVGLEGFPIQCEWRRGSLDGLK